MKTYKTKLIIISSVLILLAIMVLSLVSGEYEITALKSLQALVGIGEKTDVTIIQAVRLPRIIVGALVGATLAVSGIFIRTALNNPLADSGILGIQSGAVAAALIVILILPQFITILPLFAFVGGMIAFGAVIFIAYNGRFNAIALVLAGVAVNSFFLAITGIIQIYNANKLMYSLSWLNGSIANISFEQMQIILIYSIIFLTGSFFFIPILKLLRLDDTIILSLGKNPSLLRIIIAIYGVMLATISVSFVGIFSFIGIIIPPMAQKLVGFDFNKVIAESIILGAILVVATDLFQRLVFAPMEMPVGIIIGLLGSPFFVILLRGKND